MVRRTVALLAASLAMACSPVSRVEDPDPNWTPTDQQYEIFDRLLTESESEVRVVGRGPPFDRLGWCFVGLGGPLLNDAAGSGFSACFEPSSPLYADPEWMIELRPRCAGDLGDLHFHVTGTRHPGLIGPTSAFYEQSVRDAVDDISFLIEDGR